MAKRIVITITLAVLMSAGLYMVVLAGTTADFGTVPGTPARGNVNWTAWHSGSLSGINQFPDQILTEDSTNASTGVDKGYDLFGGVLRWILKADSFNDPDVGTSHTVTVLLGGLGTSAGSLWSSAFTYTDIEEFTDHGVASAFAGTAPCPTITSASKSGDIQTITWSGPNGNYHIYWSTEPSGANNGASNGRYSYLNTTTVSNGSGTWSDTYASEAWYIVIHATSGGVIDGCHSEEARPTAVTISNFTAQVQVVLPSVLLQWDTDNELTLVGFNIYRAATVAGLRQKLNTNLIPAQHPGQMVGDQYSYEDEDVFQGDTYYYWIEAVKLGGMTEEIGPRSATLGSKIYLPMILR